MEKGTWRAPALQPLMLPNSSTGSTPSAWASAWMLSNPTLRSPRSMPPT